MKFLLLPFIILLLNIHLSAECVSGDCVNGKGAFQYPDGSRYEGMWAKGTKTGDGVFYNAGGTEYHGSFKNDKPHGEVLVLFADGRRKKAVFSEGKTVKFIRTEESEKEDDLKFGEFNTTGRYKGWYKGDQSSGFKPHGKGAIKFKTGSRYEGSWVNGRIHGRGRMEWDNGSRYEGEWDGGKRCGYGTYFWPDGSKHTGLWRENMRNGYGVFTSKDGAVEKGIWKDDRLVEKKSE